MAETFTPWDPVKYLNTEEDIRLYFWAALEEDCGDGELVKKVLGNIARALAEKRIKHDFGIGGMEISQALSDDPGLSFATVSRIVHALGLKLTTRAADPPPEEIIYRAVSREEAQGEILDLLAVEPGLCYDDISDRLRIEMEMVVDICIELEDEGVIKVDA